MFKLLKNIFKKKSKSKFNLDLENYIQNILPKYIDAQQKAFNYGRSRYLNDCYIATAKHIRRTNKMKKQMSKSKVKAKAKKIEPKSQKNPFKKKNGIDKDTPV